MEEKEIKDIVLSVLIEYKLIPDMDTCIDCGLYITEEDKKHEPYTLCKGCREKYWADENI